MLEQDFYDTICDVFRERMKEKRGKRKEASTYEPHCRKTPYHTTIFMPPIPEDRQSSYTFQCNEKARMCNIGGDAYILREKSKEAFSRLNEEKCELKEPRPHVTANYSYFNCYGKSYEKTLKIAKILKDY